MHNPSPPSRTGAPVSVDTRSTIGKPCHAVILIGLTVPVGRSIGPAEEMPTPRTRPPAVASASVTNVSTTAHTASASPSGVGSFGVMRQRAVIVDETDGDLRAADVDCESVIGHQCLWVLSG